MTGCYAQNVGLPEVLHPWSEKGINSEETTLAEVFKAKGYRTAIYGKWHLGHHPQFLPTRNGFDEFFGLPYSNDMWPNHPTKPNFFPDLPLMENEAIVGLNPDQSQFTTQFTERTINFIKENRNNPFFIYLAHVMPHVPLFVSDKFKGKSEKGLYGDVVMEIDWSVGQILKTLEEEGLDDRTFVMFTSDNGPWLSYGDHAGSAGVLHEGKTTTFEGGQRVPCIMRWPGKIPPGRECKELSTTMDLLPTFANLIDSPLPGHHIDGKDIWPLISGQPGASTPYEAFYYYDVWKLDAVRSGKWKLQLPHKYFSVIEPGSGGIPGENGWKYIGLSLFDLENDAGERIDVSAEYPGVVEDLVRLAAKARHEIGDAEKKVVEGVDFFDARTYYRIRGEYNREPGRRSEE
jgi:arylsulfatase